VRNIKIYLTTKISCQVRHIRLLGWIPEALAEHVRPLAQTCLATQPYLAPSLGSRDLTQTCPAPSPDMSGLSALSCSLSGFQRSNPDMSNLSALSRVTKALSGFLAGFQRQLTDMSSPQFGHVWISDTPTARFPWRAIKGPPCLSSRVGHSVQLANTLRHSLELPTCLVQASFKSKLPRRDLSLTLE
jgi:hypothetical protein